MKIVFFGTPYLAAGILKVLAETEHEITAVVTQPDRARGRGKNVTFSPVKEAAREAGIYIMQPEKVSDEAFLDELESLNADIYVVAAYAQKLPNRLLEMAPYGCINVHPSLLPKYRGAAPLMAAILNGDDVTGVTIMKMAEKMDTGDIILQEEIQLDKKETVSSLEEKVIQTAARMLPCAIKGLADGSIIPQPQDDSKSTYVRQISKEAGLIDFSEDAYVIERKIRAYDPWPGTYTYAEGKTFKISDADISDEDVQGAAPGCVTRADKKGISIQTGKGQLIPLEVQIEGKRRMKTDEFLRGFKITEGYRFG